MDDLIAKLEAAESPSIVLDAEICWTLERDRATSAYWRGAMGKPGPLPDDFSRLPRGLGMASLEVGSPNYTASLDAALALAERTEPGKGWERLYSGLMDWRAHTPTGLQRLPLLVCSAILRATREKSNG